MIAFALNTVLILCFETLYELYEFLFLVNTNQVKTWTNIKFSINLAGKNSKKFFQNFVTES